MGMGSGVEEQVGQSTSSPPEAANKSSLPSVESSNDSLNGLDEFDQERSLILMRTLRVGDERSEGRGRRGRENVEASGNSSMASARGAKQGFGVMNDAGCPPSSSGHLDPCAQEFTPSPPGPYSLIQASLYYPNYQVDGRPYGQPTVAQGAVVPVYTAREMGMGYASIPHSPPWDRQQQQQTLTVGMQAEVGPHCLPLLPGPPLTVQCQQPAIRPYRYNYNALVSPNPASTVNTASASPSGSNATRSSYSQQSAFPSPGREHVSRALLLSAVPADLSEANLRQELEVWGPVRALQLEKKHQGIVTVHYYDLRNAKTALREIQEQHLIQQRRLQQHYNNLLHKEYSRSKKQAGEVQEDGEEDDPPPPPPPPPPPVGSASTRGLIGGKAIWAQYTIPVGLPPGIDSHNQGTLVVFNLEADVSANTLRTIFEAFGPVKELRETPSKRQHKFVEFFDVRDAARALAEMDGQEIGGKRVKIEFSRPGGQARRPVTHAYPSINSTDNDPRIHQVAPSSANNNNPHMAILIHQDPQQYHQQQMMYLRWNNNKELDSVWRRQSFSSDHALINHPSSSSSSSTGIGINGRPGGTGSGRGGGTSIGRPAYSNNCNARFSRGTPFGIVRSRRRGNASQLRSEQSAENNDIATNTSAGGSRSANSRAHAETVSHFAFDEAEAESNCSDARTTVMIKNIPNKYSQQMLLSMLDQHCISCNERITDPNEPLSAYDFVYLPIDFKNKCNLGYAFVNLTTPKATSKLYKAFHTQPWEAFNSRKICEVTYARVQGRAALEDHFRNSKFACDTDEYLPLVFSPPRNGQQLTTPVVMGGHVSSSQSGGLKNNAADREDGDSKALVTTAGATARDASKRSYVAGQLYRQTGNVNYHGTSNVHSSNNFSLGRGLNAVQQRSALGGGNASRVGCA